MGFFNYALAGACKFSYWLRALKCQSNVNQDLTSLPREMVCFHTQICKMKNAKKSMQEALDFINICRESRQIILKEEQERAVKELTLGNDVLAILPMGFGKSMSYMIFILASQKMRSTKTCILVISPLKSLIKDQIVDMESLGWMALELKSPICRKRFDTICFLLSRECTRKAFPKWIEVKNYSPRSSIGYCGR